MLSTYNEKMTYNSSLALPDKTHVKLTGLAFFYKDYLLKKLFGLYDITMPEVWDRRYFMYTLFCKGYIVTFNEGDKFGVIPQSAGLKGQGVFYQPTGATISNANIVGPRELEIDTDCTVIKLTPNYKGIWDIVDVYGDMLALCASSVSTNILNSRLAYVFTAKSKTAAESFKKMMDTIVQGDPAVVIDKSLMNDDGTPAWQSFTQNLSQNFIAPQILETMNAIEQKFDETVGIPTANTDKKERLNVAEVNVNNVDTRILADVIYDTIKEGIDKHNAMFPDYPMSINYKYDLGVTYEQTDNVQSDRNGED